MINFNTTHYKTISLEDEFIDLHVQEVDVDNNCYFKDWLVPNEGSPQKIKEHLQMAGDGTHVSVGYKRSFSGLLNSDGSKCDGLVVIDINHRVKACVDFETLVIRISKTREEYLKWGCKLSKSLNKTIEKISEILRNTSIPQKVKDYYLNNALKFAKTYLDVDKSWKSEQSAYFKEGRYDLCDEKFYKIKRYADSGNIISTIGEINNLLILKNRRISSVDTSNIIDYSILDLQIMGKSRPIVIWTVQDPADTQFYSYVHPSLDKKVREEFDKLVEKVGKAIYPIISHDGFKLPGWMNKTFRNLHAGTEFTFDIGAIFSENTLHALEDFSRNNILDPTYFSPIYIEDINSLSVINRFSKKQLDNLCKSEEFIRFIPKIVERWSILTPSTNLTFSKIEEWNIHFDKYFRKPYTPLTSFLTSMKESKFLDEFIMNFGEERLNALKIENVDDWEQRRRKLLIMKNCK